MEKPWILIGNLKVSDKFIGKSGAIAWRQLDDKDNCGDIQVKCRNLFTKEESIVILPYLALDGFKAWLDGELIQRALPYLSASTRETLINGM